MEIVIGFISIVTGFIAWLVVIGLWPKNDPGYPVAPVMCGAFIGYTIGCVILIFLLWLTGTRF